MNPAPSHPFDRPHAIRTKAVREAVAELGGVGGHYHMLVRGYDQIVRFHGVGSVDLAPVATARWRAVCGLAAVRSDSDPDHMAPLNALGAPPDDLYQTALWRNVFGEAGYTRALSMNVTEGAFVRGHVSILRTSPARWDVPDRVRDAVAAKLRDAFLAAWSEEEQFAAPDGALAVRADGSVLADEPVASWIARHDAGDWLRARARECDRSEATVLDRSDRVWMPRAFGQCRPIPGGGEIAVFEPVEPMELPPVLSRLTPLQRRIASLAAAGATAVEIARDLDRSPETVREHLTRIYDRLGLASRSELASACRRMMI